MICKCIWICLEYVMWYLYQTNLLGVQNPTSDSFIFSPYFVFYLFLSHPCVLHWLKRILARVLNPEKGLAGLQRLAHNHKMCHRTSPSIVFYWATWAVIYRGISERSPLAVHLVHNKRKSTWLNQHQCWNHYKPFSLLLIIVKLTLCTVKLVGYYDMQQSQYSIYLSIYDHCHQHQCWRYKSR